MTTPAPRTLTARWVFPVSGPPLPGGVVSVRGGTIAAVEPHGTRAADEDLGNTALVPGLVNAHTHLDLSGARGLVPPTDAAHFPDWLRGVIAYRRTCSPDRVQGDIAAGLAECLRSGTTLLGDIAADGASWDTLAATPVRAVVFREVIGLTAEGVGRWNEAVEWGRDRSAERCRAGFSPHAPYSVNAAVIMKSVECLRPVAIHLAESPAERDLLDRRAGPFVEFLRGLGVWDGAVLAESLAWVVRWTGHAGSPRPVLFAHGNYLPPDTPFRPHQSVAYCPRTHAAFGHPPHPFREFLRRGGRVCLGTDSLASNPDLDPLAEARFVHARYPDVPGEQVLRMLTLSGAEALGWDVECGSLEAGKRADLVAVPLPDRDAADPYELLFADHPGERRTMFEGEWRG
jgi:cytosine/adenosine deaminase-related metal-dependent hydrolase